MFVELSNRDVFDAHRSFSGEIFPDRFRSVTIHRFESVHQAWFWIEACSRITGCYKKIIVLMISRADWKQKSIPIDCRQEVTFTPDQRFWFLCSCYRVIPHNICDTFKWVRTCSTFHLAREKLFWQYWKIDAMFNRVREKIYIHSPIVWDKFTW